MKTKEDFKRNLKDAKFLKLFSGVKSLEDAAQIAQQQGYSITAEDMAGTTLTDDILASIAGGKGDVVVDNNVTNHGSGSVNIENPCSTNVSPRTEFSAGLKNNIGQY